MHWFETTVESRFLEPSRETNIDSRNREFEKSKAASNYTKLLKYCHSKDDRFVACCVITKSKGDDNWFELSGGSRNRGFEKLGFYCSNIIINNVHIY